MTCHESRLVPSTAFHADHAGGARARMDDIDIVLADQFAQAGDVAPHDERIFGIDRQVDMGSAAAQYFRDAVPAIADNDGFGTGFHQLGGYIDAHPCSAPPAPSEGIICITVGILRVTARSLRPPELFGVRVCIWALDFDMDENYHILAAAHKKKRKTSPKCP